MCFIAKAAIRSPPLLRRGSQRFGFRVIAQWNFSPVPDIDLATPGDVPCPQRKFVPPEYFEALTKSIGGMSGFPPS
jgi:hypothetical protein